MALPDARLYPYRTRVYDPVLGRFLQTDPIGYEDGLNLYAYVGNDPFNATDPTGMQIAEGAATGCALTGPACPGGAVVGAAAGGVILIGGAVCASSEQCRGAIADAGRAVGEFFGNIFNNDRGDALGEDGRLTQDDSGKVHGNLPEADEIPDDGVQDSVGALEGSIGVREAEQRRYPPGDPNGSRQEQRQAQRQQGHNERIRRERELLERLRERQRQD